MVATHKLTNLIAIKFAKRVNVEKIYKRYSV